MTKKNLAKRIYITTLHTINVIISVKNILFSQIFDQNTSITQLLLFYDYCNVDIMYNTEK